MTLISRIAIVAFLAGATPWVAPGPFQAMAETPATISPDQQAQIDRFLAAVQMGDVLAVMRDEGVDYGQSLEDEMFPGRGGARWQAIVEDIYGLDKVSSIMTSAIGAELAKGSAEDLANIVAFFEASPGKDFVRLEIEARRSLLDKDVEEAATVLWQDMQDKDKARAKLIERFVAVNDLIESNVMGALNSNMAFYRGLAAEGGLDPAMTEGEMLQEVWSQEDAIRDDMVTWLYPYLALAYQSVPLEDLETYVAFSESSAGQRMNAALFSAYDTLFRSISLDLGRAAALQILGNDI